MAIKWPLNGWPYRATKLGEFVDLSWFFKVILWYFVVLIMSTWPIKVPGHIPILFGSFLELPICSPNLAPYTPYLSQKQLKKYKNESPHIFQKYDCYIYGLPTFCQFLKRRAPDNHEESSNEISEIMEMMQISTKRHEWIFANVVPISMTEHKMTFVEF